MPTVLRSGPYRIYFVSHDLPEPPHVNVDRDEASAKFWLQPVALARNLGFGPPELRVVERLVVEHQAAFLKAWNEYSRMSDTAKREALEVYRHISEIKQSRTAWGESWSNTTGYRQCENHLHHNGTLMASLFKRHHRLTLVRSIFC